MQLAAVLLSIQPFMQPKAAIFKCQNEQPIQYIKGSSMGKKGTQDSIEEKCCWVLSLVLFRWGLLGVEFGVVGSVKRVEFGGVRDCWESEASVEFDWQVVKVDLNITDYTDTTK
ncbi:hypothetical protein ACLOJK_019358, partial [Asimina triloba]